MNLTEEVIGNLNASNCRLFHVILVNDATVTVLPWHSHVEDTRRFLSDTCGYAVTLTYRQDAVAELTVQRPESIYDHLREPYASDLAHVVLRSIRDQQAWDIAGEDGESPYDRLLTILNMTTQYVRYLRHHIHDDDEAGCCMICGRDGRV